MQIVQEVLLFMRWVDATGIADTIQLGIWIYLLADWLHTQSIR